MNRRHVVAFLLGTQVLFGACATAGGIRSEPIDAGVSRSISADYDRVTRAAREAIVEVGLEIHETKQAGDQVMIVAAKGVSAFSWGELVRVVVEETSLTETTVRVITQRRLATNVTAKGDWSTSIFSAMESKVSGTPVSTMESKGSGKPADAFTGSRVRKLAPGTEIIVTVTGSLAGKRYVVLADDEAELTLLKLTDPKLPSVARGVLRDMAAKHPDDLAAAARHSSFVNGTVRVAPDGVFVVDRKVVDLDQVIEHIARADVAEIADSRGAPLTPDRPVEIAVGAGGVLSWAGSGGDLRVMVSVPHSERRSIEGFAGVYRGNDFFDTRGVYGFQIRQEIMKGRRPGIRPFWTYGLMGIVARYETYDCPYVNCGPRMSTHVLPPFLGLVGGGVQYTVTPRRFKPSLQTVT